VRTGLRLRVPPELSARVPAEQREEPAQRRAVLAGAADGGGRAGRDAVRLLVGRRGTGGVTHHAFRELPGLLRAGDVLVVNTSRTLPAAVDGVLGGAPVVVHFSTRLDGGCWAVELRTPLPGGVTGPRPGGPAGAVVELPGGERLVLTGPVGGRGERLWVAEVPVADVPAFLHRHGRPIRYGYTERDQPLSAYESVFTVASPDGLGSAEMPSAARPFTTALVTELVSRGVQFAPITLHTGVASAEAHEPPYPEWFRVAPSTAWLVNAARAGGGRVIAVGTTSVRALESAVSPEGVAGPAEGWTDLVVTPERGVRVVDGLLTGLHEPEASHLLMLEAVAGQGLLTRVYEEAVRERYLWHEFGDVNLLLP
jgi:S-adenosylmethionine:tRNA ribosyltransferase-isomerase